MKASRRKILCFLVGLSTLDTLVFAAELPGADQHAPLRDYRVHPGGSAANMAACLALLGGEVILCSRVGSDEAGRIVRAGLRRVGVELSCLRDDPVHKTGFGLINVAPDGRIGLMLHEGANQAICGDDIDWNLAKTCDLFHVGGAMAMAALDGAGLAESMRVAKHEHRLVTSLHTTRYTARAGLLMPCYQYLDYLVCNRGEAGSITGQPTPDAAARWFQDRGVGTVAVTLGSQGCFVSSPSGETTQPGFPVQAVDTTGCGDAFTAGFLRAALSGLTLEQAAVWGNAMGACNSQFVGAMPAQLDRALFERLTGDNPGGTGE